MKFFAAFILTGLLSFAASLFFPWWTIAVVAFIVALLIHQKGYKAFLAAFFALFILWGAQSFLIDQANNHLLSTKIASVFPLGGSYVLLVIITAVVGAFVAGMAGLTGSLARRSNSNRRTF
jgi:hypothetical protein